MEKEKKPLASVITLIYRHYERLFETIASVLQQDYPAFEYIISDDGSGNFPKEKVMQFVRTHKKENLKRFRLLVNPENVGTVRHLNKVLKQCSGEYIFDISGNDIFFRHSTISEVVKAFETSGCDVLFVSRAAYAGNKIRTIFPHVGDWDRVRKMDTREKRYSAAIRTENYGIFVGANMFYRKSAIERRGYFDETYRLFEDNPMIAELLWYEKTELKPELIAILYEWETGVSGGKWQIKNPVLVQEIKHYNQYGKLKHYAQLDRKTQQHIDFGIRRETAANTAELAFVCLKYLPYMVHYLYFCICRQIVGLKDKNYIRQLDLTEHSFLLQSAKKRSQFS